MHKIYFVLTAKTGVGYTTLHPTLFSLKKNQADLQNYFSKYYDVSADYLHDKDVLDALVVPKPFGPYQNDNGVPTISVPAVLFYDKKYDEIKDYIASYFSEN
ncbi:hypothetical protein [Candidatus Enterococcus ferrettii]|uniref:Uncharacterized protein n=1 Tax=Candidatus Enterococcus ferrettii TaxID=2815324 RepID=A0ABV0EQ34_9ENTE|nr:hypothetical protein [Enterococcus sp. 665A]MBO1341352.1 hypothetical protein [Enterococcus sp. 665A]